MDKIKNNYQTVGKLFISEILYNFVNKELLKEREKRIKPYSVQKINRVIMRKALFLKLYNKNSLLHMRIGN